MKLKIHFLIISIVFISSAVFPQIHSVKLFSDYSKPLSKRLAVNKIDAVGGGAEIHFKISESINAGLIIGYQLYSLQQDSALAQWNWKFWNTRYRDRVKADLQADPTLSASINPVQKMDVIPLMLNLSFDISMNEKFLITPSIGGGVLFYTRRLYLIEDWQKRFNNYTFEYSYRNFAQDKSGNPATVIGGVEVSYNFTKFFLLAGSVNYMQVIKTKGSLGYEEFPFNNTINAKIGLTFLY